jgi:hypothetical protein
MQNIKIGIKLAVAFVLIAMLAEQEVESLIHHQL